MPWPGPLRILFFGGTDLVDCFLGFRFGGSKLDLDLAHRLSERSGSGLDIELFYEPCSSSRSLALDLESRSWASGALPKIVVLSLCADLLDAGEISMGEGGLIASNVEADLRRIIRLLKVDLTSHVIVLNASTIDPSDSASDFQTLETEPKSLLAQRLNLSLIRLSLEEGISIIDADRILAELGAATHVLKFLDYSAAAASAICAELVRIIEDYGFLDERPLIPQRGRTT